MTWVIYESNVATREKVGRRTNRNIDHRRAIMTGDGFESGRCQAQPFQTTLIFLILITPASFVLALRATKAALPLIPVVT